MARRAGNRQASSAAAVVVDIDGQMAARRLVAIAIRTDRCALPSWQPKISFHQRDAGCAVDAAHDGRVSAVAYWERDQDRGLERVRRREARRHDGCFLGRVCHPVVVRDNAPSGWCSSRIGFASTPLTPNCASDGPIARTKTLIGVWLEQ
jgi:hypothetical protein